MTINSRSLAFGLLASMLMATPAMAQVDLSGSWASAFHEDQQEATNGPDLGDFLGLPINDDARARGLSYTTSLLSQPERQCLYYPSFYLFESSFQIAMWPESHPTTGATIAWHVSGTLDRQPITIWVDGRPHPSPWEPHTPAGFTTGVWEGQTLTTYTTHMIAGPLRRNGLPFSDQATMTMHFNRYGNLLTVVGILEDPVYLTEPHILSRIFQSNPNITVAAVGPPCIVEGELPDVKEGTVPHYLPGKHPFPNEMPRLYNIPVDVAMGGAETMYPEYRKKLAGKYVRPDACRANCYNGGTLQNPGLPPPLPGTAPATPPQVGRPRP